MAGNENTTTTQFKADISQFKSAFNDAQRQIRLLNSEFSATSSEMEDWENSAEGVSAKLNRLNGVLSQEERKLEILRQQYERTVQELGETSTEAINLQTSMNNQRVVINRTRQSVQEYSDEMTVMNKAQYVARQSGVEFETALEQTRKALAQAEQSGNSFATELKAVQKAMDLSNQTGQTYEQSLEQVRRATEQAESTGNSYEQELTAVQRAMDYASRSGTDYDTALDTVRRATEQAETTGQDYEEVLRDMTAEQTDVEQSSEGMGDGFTVLKGAISSLVADGIKMAIEAFKEMATEGEKALNKLQAQTGSTSADMEKFGGVINDIYSSGVGESYTDIAEAVGRIAQQTDNLDPDVMKEYAENALYMRDTFDMDVAGSVRAVEMLMAQFGITSEEAFNLIQQGASNGLNKNDDLLDVINEYSVHFKQQGYSAEEFFNTLKAGTDEGAFSVDKVGDAYKELGIRTIDYSETTKDAYKSLGLIYEDNSGKIAELTATVDDQKEKYSDLEYELQKLTHAQSNFTSETDYFTKEDTARKIAKIKDEMSNLETGIEMSTAEMTKLQESSDGTGMTFEDLTKKLSGGGTEGKEALQMILDKLYAVEDEAERNRIGVELFGTMWEDNGAKVMESAHKAGNEISLMNESLDEAKSVRYDDVGTQLTALGRTIKSDLIQPLVDELMPYIQQIIDKVKENLPELKKTFEPLKNAIVGIVDYIINYLIPTIENLTPLFAGLGVVIAGLALMNFISNIGMVATALKTWAMGTKLVTAAQWLMNSAMSANPIGLVITLIAGLVTALVVLYNKSETFRNFVNGLWDTVKEIGGNIGEFFKVLFTETIPNAVTTAWEWITTKFTEGKKAIITWLTLVLTNITTWAKNTKDKAVETGKNFIDTIVTFFKELPGKVATWLKNTINKTIDWAKEMKNKATETATNFISSVIEKIKELPGKMWDWLKSSAEKVVDWGRDLVAKGKQSATDLFNAIVDKIKELPGKMLSIGSDLVEGLWNGINNMSDWISGKIQSFSDNVLDGIKNFFGIHSPSRVMQDVIGKNLVLGLANGIKDNAKIAISEMENLSAKTLDPLNKNIAVPISPAFSGGGMGASKGTVNNYNYNFTQTNNSPKSLSRLEIYRQSKNLLNYAKGV